MPDPRARIRAAGLPHAGFHFRHGSGFGTRICAGSCAARAGDPALSGSAATRHHTREHRTSMPAACAFPACACRSDPALSGSAAIRGVCTACAESATYDAELDAAHATSCRGTPMHSASAS